MARKLLDAICSGNVSLARDIIQDQSYRCIDSQTSRRDGTALFFCCSRGYQDLVTLLLGRNANVNARNQCLATPLHAAADNNQLRILSLLLNRGADINAQTHRGDTPLHMAAFRGHEDIVQELVDHGADFLLVNESNVTPAMEALGQGHTELGLYLNAVQELRVRNQPSRLKMSSPSFSSPMVSLDPPPTSGALAPPPPHAPPTSCHSHIVHRPPSHSGPMPTSYRIIPEHSLPVTHNPGLPPFSSRYDVTSSRDDRGVGPSALTTAEKSIAHRLSGDFDSNIPENSGKIQNVSNTTFSKCDTRLSNVEPYIMEHDFESHRLLSDSYAQRHPDCDNNNTHFNRMQNLREHHASSWSDPLRFNIIAPVPCSKEPEESIDYSSMPSYQTRTALLPNSMSNSNEILPPNILVPSRKENSLHTSSKEMGFPGTGYGKNTRYPSLNNILPPNVIYRPPPLDPHAIKPHDNVNAFTSTPSLSLRPQQSFVYSRLPSTPSSISSVELSDVFESSYKHADSSNLDPGLRSTSPMSLDLPSTSDEFRRMSVDKLSSNLWVNTNTDTNNLDPSVREPLSCDAIRDGRRGGLDPLASKSHSIQEDCCMSNSSCDNGLSLRNDLSSVKAGPSSSSLTFLNIPVGGT